MAKLKARGRVELARVSREKVMPELVACTSCDGKGKHDKDLSVDEIVLHRAGETCEHCKGTGQAPPLTTWERKTLTLMSDGKVLEKLDVRFQPDRFEPKGRAHSYGWKVKGKAKEGLTADRFVEIYAKAGYTPEQVRDDSGSHV